MTISGTSCPERGRVCVEGEYRRREIDSGDVVSSDADDARGSWQVLLSNDDVAVAISRRRAAMPYRFRNLDGDLLYFVHRGTGTFATEFGRSPMGRAIMCFCRNRRHTGTCPMPATACCWSSSRHSRSDLASTSRSAATHRSTRQCSTCPIVDYGWPEEKEYEVRIKAGGGETSIWYRNDPLKVVGWKGDLFPYRFNVKSILPIMSNRIHLAPSSWATFEAAGFAVVSFVPQIAVADLDAEELPSYHRNIDMDEVILSHANDDPGGRRPGAFSFTPQGILHGATEEARAAFNAKRKPGDMRRWTGVGVDTYRPLKVSDAFAKMTK